ncbi:hypothetical protein BGZ83_010688 [Gryganskiella cystojenkinii]|nr:hypothetical protein BGZ83_010688 [Gryganskiella cystojenkinii]
MDTAKEMLQEATSQVGDLSRSTVAAVEKTGIYQKYIQPNFTRLKAAFDKAPYLIKVGLVLVTGMSAVPLGLFAGFMSIVTVGCLILGGIAFSVVESGFATFGSLFLLPTLGVTLLIASGVGFIGFCLFATYVVLNKIFGDRPDPTMVALREKIMDEGEEARGRFQDVVHSAGHQASQIKTALKDRAEETKRALTGAPAATTHTAGGHK